LSRERSAKCFASSQYGCSFCAKADGFSQLLEVLSVKFPALHIRLDVASSETCLLESQLSSAGEGWRGIGVEGYVAERENIYVLR
jgi:hypothetical protein